MDTYESREYNGRWYTDVKAWKVTKDGKGAEHGIPFENKDRYEPMNNIPSSLDDDVIPF